MMKSLVFSTRTSSILIPNFVFSPSKSLSSVPNSVHVRNPNFLRGVRSLRSPSSSFSYSSSTADESSRCYEPAGEIHVIVGPMFAGKTTSLLRRIQSESSSGRNVAVIKSSKDTRYGLDSIVTHDGEKLPCWPLAALSSFKERIGHEAYHKLEVIGIDEAQFFEDLHDFCIQAADHDGKTVIVAGLDGDYLRRSFGVLDLIPIAESVTKLKARCELCGKPAAFTLRKTEETEREVVAGADVYMPVCRHHYATGQLVKEAARTVLQSHKVRCGALS